MNLFRKKLPNSDVDEKSSLQPCLTATDLTLLGIGVIIGAGVFVLTGVAAATRAGPAITISYIVAGLASLFAALAYAELTTSIGGCGSAYNYTYTAFGEFIAWIVGWDLLFEYALSVSTVSIGWSGYMNDALIALKIHLPNQLLKNPFEGGWIDLPAVLIIVVLGILLCLGTRQSARVNFIAVIIKLLTIGLFITVAVNHVQWQNWQPFLPFGWQGIMQGAALVFFAYIGFDALSTAAEETVNPKRDIPIGITLSVMICSSVYVIVAGLLTLIVPYTTLNVKSPVADAILHLGFIKMAGIISLGAIAGLTTVMLVMYYGLTRIILAISRDGLFPSRFAKTHPKTKSPILIIVLSGLVIATIAGLMPIKDAAELVNIGTLSAFVMVCSGVIVLRYTQPNVPRPFKLPWNPLIPVLGILFCVYLMLNLPLVTWERYVIWLVLGLGVYFGYGYRNSGLNNKS